LLNGETAAQEDNGPVVVGELVTVLWPVPAPDDASWPVPASAPPGRASRRRAVVAVLVAAAVVGAATGGVLAFRQDGSDTDSADGAGTTASTTSTRAGDSGTASGPTSSAVSGTEATGPAVTDPRAVPVPADPLVGVADPAFTRADDESQPVPGEWSASRDATGTQERKAAPTSSIR
jgi:hypothetical protein